ncbi:MAG TPA: inositol monophosphatase family protein [Nitrososphaeraceae archaeon]|nr:inositol monophosphatase family protein [Nitrososphaeraceae archaeon]
MIIIDVLKDACKQVYEQTRGLVGTVEGNKKFGIGAGGDVSRMIDLVAEKTVINTMNKYNFKPTIIGEECGRIEGKQGYMIMDAIDGTTNASRSIPFYCCSLAYATDFTLSSVIDSAVIDLVRGDLYYASKEKGAFLNDHRITVKGYNSNRKHKQQQEDILIGMNISGISEEIVNRLTKIFVRANHARHFGANALELCYFARGFMDAYIDFRGKIRATDMAAAYLIVKEAGGKLFSSNGSELDSELGVNNTMSFLAVSDDNMFGRLADDIGMRR